MRPALTRHDVRKAVVLLSGGLDSATTLYIARRRGYHCLCLCFDYGQRHRREIRAALAVARAARCPARVIQIRLPREGSALTDRRVPVPTGRSLKQIGHGIPATYVPARNTVLLGYAASFAEAAGAEAIFIGAHSQDYSGYPDCRPEYYRAFRRVLGLGTRVGIEGRPIRIITPLIRMGKAQIIRLGQRLRVPYRFTWSCYGGGNRPCGRCDSCLLRAQGFQEAGVADPARRR